ncbi:hypothetical protein NC652_036190 [Populus alba x Populus x berolinensis]|nr:hypothetical protein NC652_036190 [Populus alba x Populus x berolinensis]
MELKSDDTEDVYLDVINDSVHTFTGHTGELYAVACNPIDATLVATGGAEDKGFLWKIGDGDWKVELNVISLFCFTHYGHEDSVSCLAFSADGQLLASGGVGATVRIWDSSGHHRHKLEDASSSSEVEWHPRRPFALAGSTDCIASMWDAEKGVLLNAFYGHGGSVTCGDFTPDDHIICTGSTDATLRIWDAIRSEAIHVVRVAEVLIAHKSYASFCTAAFIAPIKFTRTSYSRSGSRISFSAGSHHSNIC